MEKKEEFLEVLEDDLDVYSQEAVWVDGDVPLDRGDFPGGLMSEELQRLDEEHRRQIEETRAWLEEEEAADELLRKELAELQLADQKNHELSAKLIHPEPEPSPEILQKIQDLEKKVKFLQDDVKEKSDKLNQRHESYTEVLSKLNETTERMISNDKLYEESLFKVKQEYGELETVLKEKIETYKRINKEFELRLNAKEEEVQELKESLSKADAASKSSEELSSKLDTVTKKFEELTEYVSKIKLKLKSIKTERDKLKKELNATESSDDLKKQILELEKLRDALIQEKEQDGGIVSLRNHITLLEEEKGNLQLQLVDLEELKERADQNETKMKELDVLNKENQEMIAKYCAEIDRLESSKVESSRNFNSQEEVIQKLKETLQKVTEQNITSAMKCVEFEEIINRKNKELQQLSDFNSEPRSDVCHVETAIQTEDDVSTGPETRDELVAQLILVNKELTDARRESDELLIQLNQVRDENSQLQLHSLQMKDAVKGDDRKSHSDSEQTLKFKKLAANYKIKSKLCQDLQESVLHLNETIVLKEKQIVTLIVSCGIPRDVLNSLFCDSNYYLEIIDRWEIGDSELVNRFGELKNVLRINSKVDDDMDRKKLTEEFNAKQMELNMLQTLYDKECSRNEIFQSELDQIRIEWESSLKEIENKDNVIEKLLTELTDMKQKMSSVDSDVNQKYMHLMAQSKEMVSRLDQAESFANSYHLYREEMEKQVKGMSENERSLVAKISELNMELQYNNDALENYKTNEVVLSKKVCDLEAVIEVLQEQKRTCDDELHSLRETRNAYNNTLDKIEILNGELKEAMEEFEVKNEKVLLLENERGKLIQNLEELECAFNDIEKKLEDSEISIIELQSQLGAQQSLCEEYQSNLMNAISSKKELEARLNDAQQDLSKTQDNKMLQEQLEKTLRENEKLMQLVNEKSETLLLLEDQLRRKTVVSDVQTQHEEESMPISWSDQLIDNPLGDLKDEEDGWGWMSNEGAGVCAQESLSMTSCEVNRSNELTQTIHTLEQEKMALLEELNASKLKCQKLMKKLKEVKTINDQLEKTRNVPMKSEFSDLDFALQEEMRSQNEELSTKISELTSKLSTLKAENESLYNRVATLTSANEQLVDMKERQDIEVQMWQKRSNDYMTEISGLKWSLQEFQSEGSVANESELVEKCKYLAQENTEIHKSLSEKQIEVERALIREQDLEQELSSIHQQLKQHYTLVEENEKLKMDLAEMKLQIVALETQISLVSQEKSEILCRTEELRVALSEAEDKMKTLSEKKAPFETPHQIDKMASELQLLKEEYNEALETMSFEKQKLLADIARKQTDLDLALAREYELETLLNKVDFSEIEKEREEIKRMKIQIQSLEKEKHNLNEEIVQKQMTFEAQVPTTEEGLVVFKGFASSEDDVFAPLVQPAQQMSCGSDVDKIRNELDSVKTLNAQLSEQIALLTIENENLKMNVQTSLETASSLEDKSNKIMSEYYEKQMNIDELLQSKDEKIQNLINQLSIAEQEAQKFSFELESIQIIQLPSIESRLEDALKDNAILKSELDGVKQYMGIAQSELTAHHENSLKALQDSNLQLNALLQDKDNKIKELAEEITSKNQQIDNIQSVAQEFQQNQEVAVANEEVIRLSALISENQSKIKLLEDQLDERNLEIITLSTTLNALENSDSKATNVIPTQTNTNEYPPNEVGAKLSEVTLKQMPESTTGQVASREDSSRTENLLQEKDDEISRLTKALIDTQEKLLLTEQGRIYSESRTLQYKLDQALYTLHARDVKCEELTLEIMQLLEERDSLQIRLSESLRAFDSIKKEMSEDTSATDAQKSPFNPKTAGRLNETQVEYQKDPTVQIERESRHKQHMELYSNSSTPQKLESTNNAVDYGIFNWFFGGSPSPRSEENVNE